MFHILEAGEVHLKNIDVVGFHSLQAQIDVDTQLIARPNMGPFSLHASGVDITTALGGEEIFAAPMADKTTDAFLA